MSDAPPAGEPRKRGRPRGFDPDVALRAATERFRTHGFAATSLDDLAEATGLNRPSLYAAFGDKRALYLATLDRATARARRGFARLHALGLPLRQSLEALFQSILTDYLSGETGPSGCIMISTSATSAIDDPEVRARLLAFLAVEDDGVEALFAAHADAAAAAKARVVTAVIHSLSVRARAGASAAELEQIAQDCIALVTQSG